MTRISLRETYDNRSVIAQIAKVTDTAEDAAETVQQKAAEINDALTDVNAAVQAAEGAVTTANAASASAQASAQTVAGYENRLGAVESGLDAVTLRVTTAEGNIVTIQGRVTALETADGQNVKINAINDYAVGLTGNQNNIGGIKGFVNGISAYTNDWHTTFTDQGNIGDIKLFAKLRDRGNGRYLMLELSQTSNTASCYGILGVHNINTPVSSVLGWFVRKGFGANNPLQIDSIVIASDGVDVYLGCRKKVTFGNLHARVKVANNYGTMDVNPTPQIEWLSQAVNIGDGTGYTLIEAVE